MIKRSCGIGTSSYARNDVIWKFRTRFFEQLLFDFFGYNRLKACHHVRIGVRPYDRTDDVVSVGRVIDPVTHCLVGRVFEGLGAAHGGTNFCAEHSHTSHVGRLALDVNLAHVHDTLHSH